MKNLNYIIGIAAILLILNSCSEWLDVSPRSEMKESVMFSTENGYKRALTGVYIKIAESSLYGKNTTMYIPELFTRHWTIPTSTTDVLNRLANFDYTYPDVESLFSTVWLNYYNAIVQANDILTHLENPTVQFEYNNDALIKGEALGLRAFLHLDLLRFFGPVPAESNPSALAIPYVTEKTKDPTKLVSISYADVLKNIEADLDAAEKLLAEVDPIVSYKIIELTYYPTGTPQDEWQLWRQSRFNYYACLGTKARLYQWIGDKVKASEYAKKVIEAVNSDNTPKFTLTKESDYASSYYVNLTMFYGEQLFGIHNPDMQGYAEGLYSSSTPTLTQTQANMNNCYEYTVSESDVRYKPSNQPARYWEEVVYSSSTVNHFRKYTGNNRVSPNNRVPLLRLAEMYLLLIENLPLEEAKSYFSEFRIARSMDASTDDSSMANDDARMARIEREYRKEFFGEGQMFFFYKRFNTPSYTWPSSFTLPVGAYVVPKPNVQLSFE